VRFCRRGAERQREQRFLTTDDTTCTDEKNLVAEGYLHRREEMSGSSSRWGADGMAG